MGCSSDLFNKERAYKSRNADQIPWKSEAAAAAVDPELKAALAELQRKKADLEAAQTRVNALKNKKSRA